MRKLIFTIGAMALLPVLSLPAAEWLTDYPAAQAKAKAENKLVLLDFTGSDWCGWCMKLKAEVFDQPEFAAFAKDNLVLVEVDFPRRKALSAEQQKANHALAAKYQVQGYPSIIVLDGAGQNLGKTGYRPGGPKAFIADLQRMGGNKISKSNVAASAPEPKGIPDPPPAPLFNGAPPGPPPDYKEIQLKGISGPKGRRLAIINNQTLGEGESAMVKFGQKQIAVKCVAIKDNAAEVLIGEDGQKKELKLGR